MAKLLTRSGASAQAAMPSKKPQEAFENQAVPIRFARGSWPRALRQAAGVGVGLALATSTAEASPIYDVRASLSERGDVVAFDQVIAAELDEPSRKELTLWLYADKDRHEPPSFDEFSAERLYVGNVSHGGFERLRIRIEGCPETQIEEASPKGTSAVSGRFVTLPICASAIAPLRIRIEGALRLARRYGTLGFARNGSQLGDPWYPLLVEKGSPAPKRARHRLSFASESPRVLVTEAGVVSGTEISFEAEDRTHAAVFALEDAHVVREVVRGVDISFVTKRAPVPRPQGSPSGDADPFDPDAARKIIASAERAIAFARTLGMVSSPITQPRGLASKLVVVEIEERQRLAVPLPGILAVSDRAFRLFPLGEVERFHELGIRRRAFSVALEPHLRAVEDEADLPWASDLSASLLLDLSIRAENEPRKSPSDLVGFASFHPAVDQLLYAPQVAFRGEYFSQHDGEDPDRDGAERALNPWPWGRFVLEKLRDRLGPEGLAKAARLHLFEGVSIRKAATIAHGEPLDGFFETWIGKRRSLAYRLGDIRSTKLEGGFEHVITVERLGDVWIREPVTVEVKDEGGRKVRGVWDEAGASGEVRLRTLHPLDSVTIDPEGRLSQDPKLTKVHPKYDDTTSHPFRPPVFNAFAANLSFSRARPDALIDFSLRRKYDVREGFGLRLSTSARGYGGGVRYFRGLGSMVDLNSTAATASVGVSALRSDTGFGGSRTPVTEAGINLGVGMDTRRQINDPATGQSLSFGTFIGLDHEDSGKNHLALTLSLRGQRLFWTSVTNVVALTAGASLAKCPALPHALPTLGSRQLLRGYETDELLGCATSFVSIEDRWSPLRGFYWNAANLAWLRKLQFVPFAAAGTVSSRDTAADIFRRFYLEAGFGLRAHYDYAGVQPAVMALDFAFPLTRKDDCRKRDGKGVCTSHRSPVGVWVSFEQTF